MVDGRDAGGRWWAEDERRRRKVLSGNAGARDGLRPSRAYPPLLPRLTLYFLHRPTVSSPRRSDGGARFASSLCSRDSAIFKLS